MGGTIANGGSAPMLPPVTWAGTAAYGSASDAGVIGGGAALTGVAMPQPAVMSQPTSAWQAVQPAPAAQPQPSVTPTTAPATDVIAALMQLTGLLEQLASILAARQGAANVQGGGAAHSGCGCGVISQSPSRSGGAHAAPRAVEAARSDKPGRAPATQAASAPAGGSVREKIVAKAREELARNVSEDAGTDKDKAGNIRKYRTAVTGPGENPDAAEAWCADFASWIWKEAGTPWGSDGQGDDYTRTMVERAKGNGSWREQDPQPGDMVFIDWAGGEGVDHVAIVEKVENGRVHTIGGNESDRLKTASYASGDPKMMGFVSPTGA